MHEMSLAESVLQIVEQTAERESATRVHALTLEIGELAAVELEALRCCLQIVLRDSIAAEARIDIEHRAGQGRCRQCAAEFALHELYQPCPQCGSYQVEAIAGRELRVAALEME